MTDHLARPDVTLPWPRWTLNGPVPGGAAGEEIVAQAWRLFDGVAVHWMLRIVPDIEIVAAARVSVLLGCNSPSLEAIAALEAPDRQVTLAGVLGTYRERNTDAPLIDDLIKRSTDELLARMLAGEISPEQAAAKLWSLGDRDVERTFDSLQEFRDLAISLSIYEDPDCDIDLDEWRNEMLSLARSVMARGGIAPRDLEYRWQK